MTQYGQFNGGDRWRIRGVKKRQRDREALRLGTLRSGDFEEEFKEPCALRAKYQLTNY